MELACLLYGVLRFGEGEWRQVMEGTEFTKLKLTAAFSGENILAQPSKRSSHEIAQKWK